MTALASIDDLLARMTITPDPARAAAVLDDASAAVRAYTGQHLTLATTTDRMRMRHGRIRLPQRPVVEVDTVADVAGTELAVEWDGLDVIAVPATVADAWSSNITVNGVHVTGVVDVTYTHGYDPLPAELVAVVCNIAARSLGVPPESAPLASETITNYSYTIGPVGASGPIGLFSDERSILDRYRTVAGVSWTS